MSGLGDTVGNFRSLGAAVARLVADLLDGPELCVHDLSEDPEWSRGWEYGWRAAEEVYGVGRCESSRAEGTQRAQTPGEESGNPSTPPSPGEPNQIADSELLAQAADAVDRAARTTPRVLEINDLLNLADALRDRAAQFAAVEAEPFVAEEDLAAHITALMSRDGLGLLSISTPVRWGDEIATALLDDFYITKK